MEQPKTTLASCVRLSSIVKLFQSEINVVLKKSQPHALVGDVSRGSIQQIINSKVRMNRMNHLLCTVRKIVGKERMGYGY